MAVDAGDAPPVPTGKRARLADVAAAAGVSRALVSIVIREAPGASAATRERVLRAADELGYRPDVRARLLARSQSKLIGTVFGMAGTFHFDVLDGLYNAAEDRGYELILSALTQSRGEARAVQSLQDFRFDALIMIGPDTEKPTLAGKVPLVLVGWRVDDPTVDSVRTSDAQGMALAVDHLVERGHRRIVHVDGGDGTVSKSPRRVPAGHGCARPQSRGQGARGRPDPTRGVYRGTHHDRRPAPADGGHRVQRRGAVSVLEAFLHAGHRVPQDVSVIGWDNSLVSKLPHIRLSTVSQDPPLIAKLAIDRAIARVEGVSVGERDIVLEPSVKVRATTGSARVD
jgi:DNA-binding LacI/PurR family transcriptional regulator